MVLQVSEVNPQLLEKRDIWAMKSLVPPPLLLAIIDLTDLSPSLLFT